MSCLKTQCSASGEALTPNPSKLGQNFREKWNLPPNFLGRSLLILGRSVSQLMKAGLSVLLWLAGWPSGWLAVCMHACMDGCLDECMDGWHWWIGGWMECRNFSGRSLLILGRSESQFTPNGWWKLDCLCLDGWINRLMDDRFKGWIQTGPWSQVKSSTTEPPHSAQLLRL